MQIACVSDNVDIIKDLMLTLTCDTATLKNICVEANDCVTDQYTVHHTMSFGVTEFDSEKTIEQNVSDADEKLYAAKEGGRNRVIK